MSNSLQTGRSLVWPEFRVFGFGVRIAVLVSCLYWLAMFTGTHLPRLPGSLPRIDDKLAHFGAYFVLTILMCYSTRSQNRVRRFGVIGVVAMVYGAFDELTQTFVPNRRCDIWDYTADVAGIWIAIGIYLTVKSASSRFLHRPAAPEPVIHRLGGPIVDQNGQRTRSA